MSAMSTSSKAASSSATRRRGGAEGIVLRHGRACTARRGGGHCTCTPAYQAQVWAARERKTIRRTFPTLAQARAWRQESQVALRRGTLRAPSPTTLSQAAEGWLTAATAGLVRTRSGDPYKPSAIRAYRQALNHRVLPTLGSERLTAISHLMLQDLADHLNMQGLSASRDLPACSPTRRGRQQPDPQTQPARRPWTARPHRPPL
jgi:hypothetical protein